MKFFKGRKNNYYF